MAPLEIVHASNGVVWLRSSRLADAGFLHGFSTRRGGVSTGAYASLNLAGKASTGGRDEPEALAENLRRFTSAVGAATLPIATVRQVHGARVAEAVDHCARRSAPRSAGDRDAATDGDGSHENADALRARRGEQVACLIRVADCVPILVADPSSGAVVAIHAGWRGIVAGVVGSAVAAIRRAASTDSAASAGQTELIAAIGPCAGVESFEVGEEVAEAFITAQLGAAVRRHRHWSRPHVDLFAAVRSQLLAAGVEDRSIDGEPICSIEHGEEYFSHRRDGGRTGRMAALIAPRA